jgi:hypothetical protein
MYHALGKDRQQHTESEEESTQHGYHTVRHGPQQTVRHQSCKYNLGDGYTEMAFMPCSNSHIVVVAIKMS